ncbi:MAG: pyrroline-5-carboxylate reductase [Planctomycetia bacterium]|nr:pyrroline-5-carboxylate reductase [Planctomycetia bacterium]
MLVLSRKKNESVVINDNIRVFVVEIRGDKVRLGFDVPKEMSFHRAEIYDMLHRDPVSAAPLAPPTNSPQPTPATVARSAPVPPQPAGPRIGFIGAGQMATALARGFLAAGLTAAPQIVASDIFAAARDEFARQTGGKVAAANRDVLAQSDVVFLAVKPQQFAAAAQGLRELAGPQHLIVSIMAGVSLATLEQAFGPAPRLVRVMPNTPCLARAGASAFCLGRGATPDDGKLVERLLSAVGLAVPLEEKFLDAVTGLSGSGPAFVYVMIEALADGGVRMGLARDVALRLAAQTVAGAARLMLETGEHPGVLKDRVASPGGTTIAGLQALEERGVRGALMAAVEAAARRSAELSHAAPTASDSKKD